MFKKTKLFELLKNEHQLTPKNNHIKNLNFIDVARELLFLLILVKTALVKTALGNFIDNHIIAIIDIS